jgi:uncharacterized repeat protein (TIGR04052 family)
MTRLAAALAALLISCGDDLPAADDDGATAPIDAGEEEPDAAPDSAPQQVAIQFAARVDGQPFACGQTYAGIGSPAADYVASDFRFYVHDVALVPAAGGDPVPLSLDQDESQASGLALLDFEDATADCEMGSPTTHTSVTGQAPSGEYSGISFKLGVPFEMNHLNPATDPAPLQQSGMSWAWQFGYKFLKADGIVGGEGFNLHLGSTGCPGDSSEQPPTGECVNPNVVAIELAPFDPAADTIVVDVGRVLRDADLTVNTPDTAPGCMSFPGDPECNTVFPKLGLPFGDIAAGEQELFSVER